MCGRYVIQGPASRYREHFDTRDGFDMAPRYNVTPALSLPVVRQDAAGHRDFVFARWGLLPSWVKEPEGMSQPINARAETAAAKPMFRHAFRKSRVLVPADAYYEWQAVDSGKQPWLIRLKDGSPIGFAGLLEHWAGPAGEVLTFALLTTAPNPLMAKIHDRMPVIIPPADYARWLDPALTDAAAVQRLMMPFPEAAMEAWPVSRRVNSPKNDGPELLEPIVPTAADRPSPPRN